MSVKKWLLTFLILCIPIVDIVMLFVWAFGSDCDERKSFAQAALIWMLICVALSIIFAIVGVFSAFTLFNIGT